MLACVDKIGLALLSAKKKSDNSSSNSADEGAQLLKRYTLQVERLFTLHAEDTHDSGNTPSSSSSSSQDEWHYRDCLLKVLYDSEIGIAGLASGKSSSSSSSSNNNDYRWQVQMRTSRRAMQTMSRQDDLFKVDIFEPPKCV